MLQAAARALTYDLQDGAGGLERLEALLDPLPAGTEILLPPFARLGAQCPQLQTLLECQRKALKEQALSAIHKSAPRSTLSQRLDKQWPQQAAHAAKQSLQGLAQRNAQRSELAMQQQTQRLPDLQVCFHAALSYR